MQDFIISVVPLFILMLTWYLFHSVVGTLGVPPLNGAVPSQQAITMPINPTAVLPNPVLPAQAIPMAPEPIGMPSECLLLKNMFDPATEVSAFVHVFLVSI